MHFEEEIWEILIILDYLIFQLIQTVLEHTGIRILAFR